VKRELTLKIAGQEVLLLADKALYWPQRKVMFIADAHFGKAAAYRALGQQVPRGTTRDNLLRLDALLAHYPTRRLIFLGDLLHAPKSHAPDTLAALHEWRRSHATLLCTLIRGNHDRRAGDPPSTLEFGIVNEPWPLGPFALRHTPVVQVGHHVIAGHLHPVFQLCGKGRQSLRLPCFESTDDITVLPSFGDFTGGKTIEACPGKRFFVTDGSYLWPVMSGKSRAG